MAQITLNSNGVASNGSLVLQSNGTTTAVTIDSTQRAAFVAGTAAAPAITTSGDTNTGIFFPAADTIAFAEGGVEALRLDSSGNMGLGVTPSAWFSDYRAFQIASTSAVYGRPGTNETGITQNYYRDASAAFKYIGNGYAAAYVQLSGGGHGWFNGANNVSGAGAALTLTQAMTLDASGNLGLGVTSTTFKLHVAGTGYFTGDLRLKNSGSNTSFIRAEENSTSAAYTYATMDGRSTGYWAFSTNDTERARIDSSGNLLVGTTSVFGGSKLTVSSASGRIASFASTAAADSTTFGIYVAKFANDSTTSQRFVGFSINNDNNGSGQINANGASQAAFGSFSDARLKENIVDLSPQLANVLALRPVEFDYKDGSGHQTGFVAQEMQQVYPDAIGEQDGFLTVTGYGKTEARLIKAIQEQQALITSLTARITALEA